MRPGHLHVIDLDGTVRTVSDDVTLTNGLGFSPDGKTLYHSDSRRHTVRAYDVHDDGTLSAWRPFAVLEGQTPDGLAVAEDGSVYVAVADAGCVAVFAADGSPRPGIPVPLPMVTSVCFGGDSLEDLYVVTGSREGTRKLRESSTVCLRQFPACQYRWRVSRSRDAAPRTDHRFRTLRRLVVQPVCGCGLRAA